MYYLYNIPPGVYTLEVWVPNSPMSYQIQVDGQAYTDIAPIRVPRSSMPHGPSAHLILACVLGF